MPIYDYKCSNLECSKVEELLVKFDEKDQIFKCSSCNSDMSRLFSSTYRVEIGEKKQDMVQYWKDDPKSPGGFKVMPHKNRYFKGR